MKIWGFDTPEGLWQTSNGDEYDAWAIKVINLLKLKDFWHFIVEEDPSDPKKFNALIEFEKKEGNLLPYVSYKTL